MRARRLMCAAGGAIAIALVLPGVASAHVRIGRLAVDVRVRVLRPPGQAPFSVVVDQGSRSLRLSVEKGHRVVVLGSRVAAVYLLLFAIGGAGVAIWAPRELRVAAAAWLGLVGLMAGLAYGQVFLHGVVLSVLPATVSRAAAALAVGSGATACLLGGLFYARLESAPQASPALPRR